MNTKETFSTQETLPFNSVGIIGHGHFGALTETLMGRFSPGTSIKIFSPERDIDAKRFFPAEEVAKSDAVVLAVPIRHMEKVLTGIRPFLRHDTVLVDVATVKGYSSSLIKRLVPHQPYISTHPMFGPESYKKRGQNVLGFRVAVTGHNLAPDTYETVREKIKSLGFDVREMSADAHDMHAARSLFLTHVLGQIVSAARFERTEIDTQSFGALMDAVESVRGDTELFMDVYRFNKVHCDAVLERLGEAGHRVLKMLATIPEEAR